MDLKGWEDLVERGWKRRGKKYSHHQQKAVAEEERTEMEREVDGA